MVPPEIIDDIKNRLDILELVSDHVDLKRVGKNYLGLCPFHTEKTPSFTVSQEKQIYHCFGCGKGGDLISFYMGISNASFYEALEALAGQSGIELPTYRDKPDGQKDSVVKANEVAMMIFHRILTESDEGKPALQYLQSRQVTKATIKDFLLGVAPTRWEGLIKACSAHEISPDVLLKAGLLYRGQDGKASRDLFRQRLIFPIMDSRSRVIGFGGRALDGREPKYLNTPETKVFSKGRNLYGLHLAKNEIRSKRSAIIVEGYMDLLALYQSGCRNVVAPLGTSLTDDQARLLSKMCDTVYLMYDGDRAGRKAGFRGGDILLTEGVVAKFVELPDGEDPASFVSEFGISAVENLMSEALEIVEAKINILRNRGDMRSVEGKRKAVGYILDSLLGIRDEIMRTLYLDKCARELDLPIELLSRELEQVRHRKKRGVVPQTRERSAGKSVHDLTEKYLLLLILVESCQSSSFIDTVAVLEVDDFINESYREIYRVVKGLAGRQGNVLDHVMSELPQELHATVSGIALDEAIVQNPEKMLEDCLKKIKARKIKKNMSEISETLRRLSHGEKKAEADRLAKQFYELSRELSSLFSEDTE